MIHVYADGGVIKKNPSELGGTWAYVHVDDEGDWLRKKSGIIFPSEGVGGLVTNNVTELTALCKAILAVPTAERAHFYTDSHITLLRVFSAGAMNGVPPWLMEETKQARRHLQTLTFGYTLLDGHPTRVQLASGVGKRGNPCSEWNVMCDDMCQREACKFMECYLSVA